ncbi:histidine kinase-like ATPase domain protein [Mycobacterium ulcerans str. Harvey]|uniref:Histidine kinase-like ATPase domain protein n=1 Tax=Mycobacterium ulcerans str. Harvey TaxID=1299332 RepID=A0ABN0QPJ6_MYCUL|nr:histidine kinase-like ATPase domain protein [Mycobacterium ulcerans str. Harvey]
MLSWLQAAEVPDEQAGDIVLVVSEACTNCIEHAYRGQSVGTMLLDVEAADGAIHARVVDSGSWKKPRPTRATAVEALR